jgi:hypothetical protein
VASIIGYALQREMKSLARHIISFVGKKAKVDGMRSAPKRKANSKAEKPGTKQKQQNDT